MSKRGSSVKFNCYQCGKEVIKPKSHYDVTLRHFCSRACAGNWKKANPDFKGSKRIPGKPLGKHRNTDSELRSRILSTVEMCPTSGCWLWPTDEKGYGYSWDGKKKMRAHRMSYEVFRGPIPTGLPLDHLCRVTCCVNPYHLQAVTIRENTMRGIGPAAWNAAKTHCKNGHPFSPENTHVDRLGKRVCRTCAHEKRRTPERRAKDREYYMNRRQQQHHGQ